MRLGLRQLEKDYDKSENDIKALQSVGQIIGEVLKQLDNDKCMFLYMKYYIYSQVIQIANKLDSYRKG